MTDRIATHENPVWRDRSDFIIAIEIDPGDTDLTREQLWARRLGDNRFELCCIPFFAYDVALGDVVETDHDSVVRRVIRRSGRFAFRAFFAGQEHSAHAQEVGDLEDLGGLVEWYSASLLAVDARDAEHAQVVADYLHDRASMGALVYETAKMTPDE